MLFYYCPYFGFELKVISKLFISVEISFWSVIQKLVDRSLFAQTQFFIYEYKYKEDKPTLSPPHLALIGQVRCQKNKIRCW